MYMAKTTYLYPIPDDEKHAREVAKNTTLANQVAAELLALVRFQHLKAKTVVILLAFYIGSYTNGNFGLEKVIGFDSCMMLILIGSPSVKPRSKGISSATARFNRRMDVCMIRVFIIGSEII